VPNAVHQNATAEEKLKKRQYKHSSQLFNLFMNQSLYGLKSSHWSALTEQRPEIWVSSNKEEL